MMNCVPVARHETRQELTQANLSACAICGARYRYSRGLRQHMRTKHNRGKPPRLRYVGINIVTSRLELDSI